MSTALPEVPSQPQRRGKSAVFVKELTSRARRRLLKHFIALADIRLFYTDRITRPGIREESI